MDLEIAQLAERFELTSPVAWTEPLRRGHINHTWVIGCQQGPQRILQRINTHVFTRPEWVMDNIVRVCQHLAAKVPGEQRCLEVIPSRSGNALHRDPEGGVWRMYSRIEPAQSFEQLHHPQQAYWVGYAFGQFQEQLADLPAPRLHETIGDFHHTPKRLARLLHLAEHDPQQRRRRAQAELDLVLERQSHCLRLHDLLRRGLLPERITHNDTKLNNLLFDAQGQPLCVVDLDTVMPGLVHYDFGDMVRTACATAAEDEENLELVGVNSELFRSLSQGYLEAAASFLTPLEVEHLAFSALVMTLEVAIRFLSDYLEGDRYFRVDHPEHNLQRARNQLQLVRCLEAEHSRWQDLVLSLWQQRQNA